MKPNSSILFADLAEKQRILKANRPYTSLEEAREKIKCLKSQRQAALQKRECDPKSTSE